MRRNTPSLQLQYIARKQKPMLKNPRFLFQKQPNRIQSHKAQSTKAVPVPTITMLKTQSSKVSSLSLLSSSSSKLSSLSSSRPHIIARHRPMRTKQNQDALTGLCKRREDHIFCWLWAQAQVENIILICCTMSITTGKVYSRAELQRKILVFASLFQVPYKDDDNNNQLLATCVTGFPRISDVT